MLLNFGDIFRFREKEYVHLARTEEMWYAALILDKEKTKDLEQFCNSKLKNGQRLGVLLNRTIFCFVTLTTKDFESRAAHLGKPDIAATTDDSDPIEPIGILNTEDQKEILKEIKIGPVATLLKELTKDILIK